MLVVGVSWWRSSNNRHLIMVEGFECPVFLGVMLSGA